MGAIKISITYSDTIVLEFSEGEVADMADALSDADDLAIAGAIADSIDGALDTMPRPMHLIDGEDEKALTAAIKRAIAARKES